MPYAPCPSAQFLIRPFLIRPFPSALYQIQKDLAAQIEQTSQRSNSPFGVGD